jgi:hypothetical protein
MLADIANSQHRGVGSPLRIREVHLSDGDRRRQELQIEIAFDAQIATGCLLYGLFDVSAILAQVSEGHDIANNDGDNRDDNRDTDKYISHSKRSIRKS